MNRFISLSFGVFFTAAFTFSLISIFFVVGGVLAEDDILIFESDHKNRIIIHGDTAEDTHLYFGDSLSHALHWDDSENTFVFTDGVSFGNNEIQDVRLENLATAPVCNSLYIGRIYHNTTDKLSYVCDGGVFNVLENQVQQADLIPFISSTVIFEAPASTSLTFILEGDNFVPSSTVSIPGFTGTLVSSSVISSTQIEIEIDAGSVIGFYDIVVSNDGVLNTEWNGNGEDLLHILQGDGTSSAQPGLSCKNILDNGFSTGDGSYWIDPNGGLTSDSFLVECDMTTDGGGWTKIPYASDLAHERHTDYSGNDTRRWLDSNFSLVLTDTQINTIRSVSSEGKQTYQGSCDGVIHYNYSNNNYGYSFGFRYHDGHETAFGQSTYPSTSISVVSDGCKTNNSSSADTTFTINDIRVPVINVSSRDNGQSSEQFGSPLTSYPAWLR